MYATVVVNRPTHRRPPTGSEPLRDQASFKVSYTYRLPDHLRELAVVGQLVQVPLRASTALGIIVDLADAPPTGFPTESIRDLIQILDPLPVVTPTHIELARWIAEEYLSSLSEAVRLMLPPALPARTFIVVSQTDKAARIGQQAIIEPQRLTSEEAAALDLLRSRGGRLRLSTLLGQLRAGDPEAIIDSLADKGLVDAHYALVPPKPAPPRVEYVRLLADEATIQAAVPRLGHASKQADVLLTLVRHADAPLTLTEVCTRASCGPGTVRALTDRGWVEITEPRSFLLALPGAETADLNRAPRQALALSALMERLGPVDKSRFLRETGASPAVIAALEKKALLRHIVEESVVLLTLSPDAVMDRVLALRGAEKQAAVLNVLRGSTGRVWVGGIYAQTGASLTTLRQLAELGLVSLHAEQYPRPRPTRPEVPPRLTPDQEAVWREINLGRGKKGIASEPFVALLHGVTGSGKTEIYLRVLQTTLAAGQRAIVLVPEISLTAQTVRRFEARFPGRVAVLHSQLSLGQRYAVWDRVRRGGADVLIGPRSALFAPVSRLGLIILDEAHDDSYKQSEPIPLPPYHAGSVALALSRLTGATVLLGTATPDLVTYYRATQGTLRLLELPRRILSRPLRNAQPPTPAPRYVASALPPVRIVDLRQELRAGNRSIFSRVLQDALDRTLAAGEQAILFLNRRGTATFVLCRDCGAVARCPNCDIPLTYHRLSHSGSSRPEEAAGRQRLVCHRCNHRVPAPSRCPQCGGRRIRYFGLGTEQVEETLRQLYPQIRLLRWDRDTATGPDHERFLQTFVDHRADVLVGTQMIAKGLDLPLVTLVGAVSADTALHLPDYRTAERTFQLLTQLAGRAGRSHRGGQVIIQTYSPGHYAIQAAAHQDCAGFYRQELAYRRQLGYPPFSRLVALRFTDQDPYRCRTEAKRLGRWLAAEIRRLRLAADLIGPAPCFFSRVQGRYRWQVVVRGHDPMPLLRDVALPWGWQIDVDPVSLL